MPLAPLWSPSSSLLVPRAYLPTSPGPPLATKPTALEPNATRQQPPHELLAANRAWGPALLPAHPQQPAPPQEMNPRSPHEGCS